MVARSPVPADRRATDQPQGPGGNSRAGAVGRQGHRRGVSAAGLDPQDVATTERVLRRLADAGPGRARLRRPSRRAAARAQTARAQTARAQTAREDRLSLRGDGDRFDPQQPGRTARMTVMRGPAWPAAWAYFGGDACARARRPWSGGRPEEHALSRVRPAGGRRQGAARPRPLRLRGAAGQRPRRTSGEYRRPRRRPAPALGCRDGIPSGQDPLAWWLVPCGPLAAARYGQYPRTSVLLGRPVSPRSPRQRKCDLPCSS